MIYYNQAEGVEKCSEENMAYCFYQASYLGRIT